MPCSTAPSRRMQSSASKEESRHGSQCDEMTVWCSAVRGIVTLILSLLAAPLVAHAQPVTKVPSVGVLSPQKSTEPPAIQREPFEQGLRALGWVPGASIRIEYRYAEGEIERLPALA